MPTVGSRFAATPHPTLADARSHLLPQGERSSRQRFAPPSSAQREKGSRHAADAGEVGHRVHGAAQGAEQAQAVGAQRRVVGVDGHLVEEGVDRRPEPARARMAPSKSSACDGGRGSRVGASSVAASACSSRQASSAAIVGGRRRPRPRPSSPRRAGCWRRGGSRRAGSCRPRCRGSRRAPRRGARSSGDRPGPAARRRRRSDRAARPCRAGGP